MPKRVSAAGIQATVFRAFPAVFLNLLDAANRTREPGLRSRECLIASFGTCVSSGNATLFPDRSPNACGRKAFRAAHEFPPMFLENETNNVGEARPLLGFGLEMGARRR